MAASNSSSPTREHVGGVSGDRGHTTTASQNSPADEANDRPSKRRRLSTDDDESGNADEDDDADSFHSAQQQRRPQRLSPRASPTPSSGDELGDDGHDNVAGPRSRSNPMSISYDRQQNNIKHVQSHQRTLSLNTSRSRQDSGTYLSPSGPPTPGVDRYEEDSPDELDHTFLRVRQDRPDLNTHHPSRRGHHNSRIGRRGRSAEVSASELNTPQESDPDLGSSAVASPSALQHYEEDLFVDEPPPAVQYMPQLVLRGHKRGVSMVKFSPDGRWIASSSADTTCKIWDARTGKLQHTLQGHLAGVSTIAWSPDSKTLASGSDDKSIRLWDVGKGRSHRDALLGHHNYVYAVAFSPKGNMLVSGSYDEAVFLWDVRTGRLMRSLPAHSDPIGGVDFVRDGTLIVSCASDGLIRVWDTATGQCLRTFFHEDTPPVVSVRFSPNGKYILAWMLDSCLRMWNYVDGRCVKTYQGHLNERYSLSGSFGTYVSSERGKLRDGRREYEDHRNYGNHRDLQLKGHKETAFVVSGSEDGSILLWDVVSKQILQKLAGHNGAVLGVDTHPTDKLIASCGLDKTVRIWRDMPSSSSSSGSAAGPLNVDDPVSAAPGSDTGALEDRD